MDLDNIILRVGVGSPYQLYIDGKLIKKSHDYDELLEILNDSGYEIID